LQLPLGQSALTPHGKRQVPVQVPAKRPSSNVAPFGAQSSATEQLCPAIAARN
jgi:hypothetical protein